MNISRSSFVSRPSKTESDVPMVRSPVDKKCNGSLKLQMANLNSVDCIGTTSSLREETYTWDIEHHRAWARNLESQNTDLRGFRESIRCNDPLGGREGLPNCSHHGASKGVNFYGVRTETTFFITP